MKKIMMFVLLFGVFLNPTQSFALSCAELPSLEESFKSFDGVIKAKVIEEKSNESTKLLKLEVEKSFKGVDQKYVTIKEDKTWGTSTLGETYLYFLNENEGEWENPLCSPTAAYSEELGKEEILQGKLIKLEMGDKEESTKDSVGTVLNYGTFFVLLGLAIYGIFYIFKRKEE
jgi:hypothetical protein